MCPKSRRCQMSWHLVTDICELSDVVCIQTRVLIEQQALLPPEPSLQPYLRTLKDVEITIMVSINLKQFHHGAQVSLELWILPL